MKGNGRTKGIRIRLTEEEYTELKRQSDKNHCGMSEYIRKLVKEKRDSWMEYSYSVDPDNGHD